RDAVFAQVFRRFYNARLADLNRVRAVAGLPVLSSAFEQFACADRLLVLTSPAFDFPATSLPPYVRYVGPQLDDPAWLTPWTPPAALAADDGHPLVLVSLSTTYEGQADVVRRIVAALADLPVRGLVTLGPALRPEDIALPPNVQVEQYVPHMLICPQADLVVTHGGLGTIITALNFGVPVVCLPMGRDQADNAARVIWRGAGLSCRSSASVAALRQVIRRALAEPRFRVGARRVAEGIASHDGVSQAIQEVVNLASLPQQTAV
ncbi:MAG TPA: nucleotide disphospho-sugar-binding domain-containing protein, partial [Ktedonobacterales bacterium]|nr:nucleotide disphospho-sugar-binding domain-containing protein [Ktedonobacterales bacterium]